MGCVIVMGQRTRGAYLGISRRVLCIVALLGAACSRPNGEVHEAVRAQQINTTGLHTSPCDNARIPMLVRRDPAGLPIRIFVPVESEGRTEVLLFDTGAGRTHLTHGLEGVEVKSEAGVVRLGCRPFVVDSWRRRPVPGIEGHAYAIGTLGNDRILAEPTELDLQAGQWIRYDESSIPPETAGWPIVPLEIVKGIPLCRVVVNGRPLRLMLDTGTSDVLLLDEHVADDGHSTVTTDTFGNRIVLVRGTATLSWPGAPPERVPVERTRSHPAFEQHVRELGGGIDGMLGLSALGSRRILIEPKRQTMRLGPLSP